MKIVRQLLQKYLGQAFFLNLPLAVLSLASFTVLPIILKNISVNDYGMWQFVLALQSWFLVFSATNITLASKRGIARGLEGTFLYAFLKRYKLIIYVSIFIVVISLFFRFIDNITFFLLALILVGYLLFGYLFQMSFFEFLIAKKRFKEWSFWKIFIGIISLSLSTLAAYFTKDILYFAIAQLGSVVVIIIPLWFYLIKKEHLFRAYREGKVEKKCISYGLKLIPINLALTTSSKLSYFIIGPFFGFSNLAIFSIANKLKNKAISIIKSLKPLFYADFTKKSQRELVNIINKNLMKIGLLGTLLSFCFIILGSFYIRFFLPIRFYRAITYLVVLSLSLPAGLSITLLQTILEVHLRYKEFAVAEILPNILRIILILILGYFGGIIGICIALALSSWIVFFFYYLITIKKNLAIKIIQKYPFLEKLAQKY